MHSRDRVRHVFALAEQGLAIPDIADGTGIARSTIQRWLRGDFPRSSHGCERCGGSHDLQALPAASYAYALGLYLGDGCITHGARGVCRLEITMDSRYPNLIAECGAAIQALRPANAVAVFERPGQGRCTTVRSYSKAWPCLFPQHGPGRKHERPIVLEPWQQRIVDAHPEPFVRGLLHSDGCRVLNRVNGKDYPRYHFTQVSDDIRRLFCRSLRQLGIEYTWNDARNVSVARRDSVARLDEFVGPKR